MNSKLYVEFHVENTYSINKSLSYLDSTLTNLFGDECRLVNSSDISRDLKSVLYRIDKPVIKSNEEAVEFFANLREIFTVYEEFLPHFTQFQEMKEDSE